LLFPDAKEPLFLILLRPDQKLSSFGLLLPQPDARPEKPGGCGGCGGGHAEWSQRARTMLTSHILPKKTKPSFRPEIQPQIAPL
jgi:hypothetical protein